MEREAKLKKLEDDLRGERNWPVCFPIWHHDIDGEIPDEARHVVWQVYISWWGLLFCLTFQFSCATVMLSCARDNNAIPSWFLTIFYWAAGLAGGFWLWYKPLYEVACQGTLSDFVSFFLFYSIHVCWCIWCAIGVPGESAAWSFSGFATALAAVDVHPFPGGMYFTGAALWFLEAVWSLWCVREAYLCFRARVRRKQHTCSCGPCAAAGQARWWPANAAAKVCTRQQPGRKAGGHQEQHLWQPLLQQRQRQQRD
ncbi:scamp family-domain-containing protein [Dunaliella salina]|uniref:Secretory carrier-associated membrane protein n=1 Tax=Dunaliella salina TaxID=3046 RepID=A0ABQ7GFI4_DUNSA|nr:scamp family-domain-containing protein [Dunaliella salina]|eukprot:KAF5833360.1 scamp family-domain-containing protein [Dunaliella salina]